MDFYSDFGFQEVGTPYDDEGIEQGGTWFGINKNITFESLFLMLSDQSMPDDSLLPHTEVGLEFERILAPLFI